MLRFWSGSLARPIGPSHSSTRQSLALAPKIPNPRPVTFVVVAVAVALPRSATTLSATNLAAHSLIIVLSIPLFGSAVTPLLVVGLAFTIGASIFYG